MSDLISRQAAIDGKIQIQLANGVEIYSDEAVPVEYLKRLPTIDAVPLIRCKDCAHYDISENGVNGICRKLIAPFDAYEWCSRSDPKEESE